MKKIISTFLALIMLCLASVPAIAMSDAKFDWVPGSTEYTAIPRDSDVIARIVIGSDVHIGDVNASPKFENAYKTSASSEELMLSFLQET